MNEIIFEAKTSVPENNNIDLDSELVRGQYGDVESNGEMLNPILDKEKIRENAGLNKRFTFDNFIVGPSNRFAHSAAIAVSKAPGQVYNPLFIYGPPGVGKTHLLYAIANGIRKKKPDANIVYIKGDQFTNELIAAIQTGKNIEFRSKYREADLFLIDDIQFIAGKNSTQEEFFHTFNKLYEEHKQIILTSDRPPKDIQTLEERLKTRFEWGLIADIQPPDLELRIAIIKKKAEDMSIDLPPEVLSYLAENLRSTIRQLEGAITKLAAKYGLETEVLYAGKPSADHAEIAGMGLMR